jgi:hypothetical protein
MLLLFKMTPMKDYTEFVCLFLAVLAYMTQLSSAHWGGLSSESKEIRTTRKQLSISNIWRQKKTIIKMNGFSLHQHIQTQQAYCLIDSSLFSPLVFSLGFLFTQNVLFLLCVLRFCSSLLFNLKATS